MSSDPTINRYSVIGRVWRAAVFYRRRLFEFAIVVGITVVLINVLTVTRAGSTKVRCASNLRQIGQACLLFCNDNEGVYPPSITRLLLVQDLRPEVFFCPEANEELPKSHAVTYPETDGSIVYVGAGLTTAAPVDVIVAYDRTANHHGEGANVLFADGRVEWVSQAGIPVTFARSDARRQEWETSRGGEMKDRLPTTRK